MSVYHFLDVFVFSLGALHLFTLSICCFIRFSKKPVETYENDALPSCTLIIPCYLPNEKNIIINTCEKALAENDPNR